MIGTAMLPEQLQDFLHQGCTGAELVPLCCETVPGFQLGPEIKRLESEGWSDKCIVLDLFEALGASDVKVSPLLRGPPLSTLCVTARMPTAKFPGCAASAHVTFAYRVCTREQDSSVSVTIESAAKAEVPYGNYFVVQERITMEPVPDGVRVTKGFKVAFREALRLEKVIWASATASQNKSTALLRGILSQHATNLHEDEDHTATQTLEVWELRQHNSLSRSRSCLPFLHHHRDQQCWLNAGHKLAVARCVADHLRLADEKDSCTLEGGRSPLSPSGVPPVRPPDGWRCKMESWVVVKPPGPADAESWQYAFNKYKSDTMWGCTSIGRRWQRRLWRCTLVEVRKGASLGAARSTPEPTLVSRQWYPACCPFVAAAAVAFVFILFVALGTVNPQQQVALALGGTIRMANTTWVHVLEAAESAGAYIFPLSAFALFCVYPPVLLATMFFEGHSAQKSHPTKPSAAKEVTADTKENMKVL